MADYDDQVKRLFAWERNHAGEKWKIVKRPWPPKDDNPDKLWVVQKLPDGPVREFRDLRAMLDVVEGVMPEEPKSSANVPLST